MSIRIYTDGACSGNPGPGGWGLVVVREQDGKGAPGTEIIGGSLHTTNNVMEMTAVVKALEHIATFVEQVPVVVLSDSKYVIDGMNGWMESWKKNGWKTSTRKPVKNQELWQRLDELKGKLPSVKFQWVRGHNGDVFNEMADRIATAAIPCSTNIQVAV